MGKVRLTIVSSRCRCGLHRAGESFIVEERCPPLCTELWHNAYPYVFALQNGALLDCGEGTAAAFEVTCPDENRVRLRGERVEEP